MALAFSSIKAMALALRSFDANFFLLSMGNSALVSSRISFLTMTVAVPEGSLVILAATWSSPSSLLEGEGTMAKGEGGGTGSGISTSTFFVSSVGLLGQLSSRGEGDNGGGGGVGVGVGEAG